VSVFSALNLPDMTDLSFCGSYQLPLQIRGSQAQTSEGGPDSDPGLDEGGYDLLAIA